MATIKNFTDSVVKKLKAASKDQDYLEANSNGFGIRVYPSGLKKFFYRYNVGKKRRFIQLGHYKQSDTTTGITLAEARRRYVEARNKVLVGGDPATEKIKAKVERKRTPFIADLVTEFIKDQRYKKKIRSWKESERALLRDFVPVYGKLKITDLEHMDCIVLLDEIARTANVMANRLQAYISSLLSYAVRKLHIPYNYLLRTVKAGGTEKSKTRNLSFEEIKTLWKALDNIKTTPVYVIAWKLILLTGQRPSEVYGIRRDEIDGDWWLIPGERTKNKLEHMVYLSPLAKELLRHPWCQESEYLLHQPKNKDKPITKDVAANQLRGLISTLPVDKFCPHDLRRTMRTRNAELKAPTEIMLRVQNRISGSKSNVDGTYDRFEYRDEKQAVMMNYDKKLQELLFPPPITYPEWIDPLNPEDTGII